jgi:outer membrane lipoprotein SlyB
MEDQKLTNYNVIATYPNMRSAHHGIATLERSGVPADQIDLQGQRAADAMAAGDTRGRDKGTMSAIIGSGVGGALAGAVIGALIGLLAAAVGFGGAGLGLLMGLFAGAFGGAVLGFIATLITRMPQAPDAEVTYEDTDEQREVAVRVSTDDEEVYRDAVDALNKSDAVTVERRDRDGQPLPPL